MSSIGISTGIFFPGRFEPAIHLPMIADAGFNAIELNAYKGLDHFNWRDAAALRELRSVGDDCGVSVWSVHSPDVGKLGDPSPASRQAQIDALCESFDLADATGASRVVSHGLIVGDFVGDYDRTLGRMVESVDRLLPHVRDSGAMLAFENDTDRADRPWRGMDVLEQVRRFGEPKQIGFVLDTGHANIAGDLRDLCAALGDTLITTHLNDNDGERDVHQPPGEGSADWDAIWTMLRGSAYGGCVMYEIEDIGGTRSPRELMDVTMTHHRRMVRVRQSG